MVGGRGVKLGRESGVKDAPLFLALALDGRDRSAATVRIAEAVTLEQLKHHRPELVRTVDEGVFDVERGTLVGARRTYVMDLIVSEKIGVPLPADAHSKAVVAALSADLALLGLDEEADKTRARLAFAAVHLSDHLWPDVGDDGIRALLPEACANVKSLDEARALNWRRIMLDALPFRAQRLLDEEVPERIEVPSGSMIAVDYRPALSEGGAPTLSVRLQELFGLADGPRVARGNVAVVLHLLSPGHKPVQVTRDLRSFWSSTYAQVKSELRARYPRHSWPDDPWTATPTAKARRRT